MYRSFSPLFGDPVFRRFSRDEFERLLRLSEAFRQKRMGSRTPMSADAEALGSYETCKASTPDGVRLAPLSLRLVSGRS